MSEHNPKQILNLQIGIPRKEKLELKSQYKKTSCQAYNGKS